MQLVISNGDKRYVLSRLQEHSMTLTSIRRSTSLVILRQLRYCKGNSLLGLGTCKAASIICFRLEELESFIKIKAHEETQEELKETQEELKETRIKLEEEEETRQDLEKDRAKVRRLSERLVLCATVIVRQTKVMSASLTISAAAVASQAMFICIFEK